MKRTTIVENNVKCGEITEYLTMSFIQKLRSFLQILSRCGDFVKKVCTGDGVFGPKMTCYWRSHTI